MNKYESVIIINHNIDDKTIEEIISKTTDLITKQGKVTQINKIGIKKLAYEIRKCKEGYYISFDYETDSSVIAEIERQFRINENILKFITVRRDD